MACFPRDRISRAQHSRRGASDDTLTSLCRRGEMDSDPQRKVEAPLGRRRNQCQKLDEAHPAILSRQAQRSSFSPPVQSFTEVPLSGGVAFWRKRDTLPIVCAMRYVSPAFGGRTRTRRPLGTLHT